MSRVKGRLEDLRFVKIYLVLKAYFDESYNNSTMCVGGLIATEGVWDQIEPKWEARIDFESRLSVRKGLSPLSRYHATDCASMKREFTGWDLTRQVKFVKKLLDIMSIGKRKIVGGQAIGIGCGVFLSEIERNYPELNDQSDIRWGAYKICMAQCLAIVATVMRGNFTNDRVRIIYDRTEEFSRAAMSAYDHVCPVGSWMRQCLIGPLPGSWEQCIALQPADLFAFEVFKLADSGRKGAEYVRRALKGMFERDMPLHACYCTSDTVAELKSLGLTCLR